MFKVKVSTKFISMLNYKNQTKTVDLSIEIENSCSVLKIIKNKLQEWNKGKT